MKTKQPKYGVEAGRLITRDGKPFVTIHRVEREGVEYVNPTDADNFTREIARAVNSHSELLDLLKELEEEFQAGRTLGIRPGSNYALKVRDAIANAESK